MPEPLGNYLRARRKQSGLSQRELGRLLGYDHGGRVAQHERLRSLPPLLIAIGYSVVLGCPVSELFAGISESVRQTVEERMAKFERELRELARAHPQSIENGRKLAWLSARLKQPGSEAGATGRSR